MLHHIKGTLCHLAPGFVVIDCGGVGFRINTSTTSQKSLPQLGSPATLYTYLHVREDILDLFGFSTEQELSCFKLLISVSGVGPKVALSLLSEMAGEKLAMCVVTGDVKSLTRAQGVGTRLAQRIVLELKDKLKGDWVAGDGALGDLAPEGDKKGEALNALLVLGYSRREAESALSSIDISSMPLEEAIKGALKQLMRQV